MSEPEEPQEEGSFEERARRMTWGPGQEPSISQCIRCRWWEGKGRCAAYPQGVPMAILGNRHDHRHPFPGDKGISFEPRPPRS